MDLLEMCLPFVTADGSHRPMLPDEDLRGSNLVMVALA